jgi:hypothetical protein
MSQTVGMIVAMLVFQMHAAMYLQLRYQADESGAMRRLSYQRSRIPAAEFPATDKFHSSEVASCI